MHLALDEWIDLQTADLFLLHLAKDIPVDLQGTNSSNLIFSNIESPVKEDVEYVDGYCMKNLDGNSLKYLSIGVRKPVESTKVSKKASLHVPRFVDPLLKTLAAGLVNVKMSRFSSMCS